MGLFGPAWMSKKPCDARKAVDEISEITSQDKLAKAARRAPLEKVREAAVPRPSGFPGQIRSEVEGRGGLRPLRGRTRKIQTPDGREHGQDPHGLLTAIRRGRRMKLRRPRCVSVITPAIPPPACPPAPRRSPFRSDRISPCAGARCSGRRSCGSACFRW